MAKYRFVDHWEIRAPIEQVYRYVSDPATYSEWWSVYSDVKIVEQGAENGVGGKARLIVRSFLGYRLKIEVETIEADPPSRLRAISRGNLEGTAQWDFEQNGDSTHATFTWLIETRHPLLNLLEPIAKPLFAFSHDYASRKGRDGLKRLLEDHGRN